MFMPVFSRRLTLVLALALSATSGCAMFIGPPTVKLTPELVQKEGRQVYTGSKQSVFKATEDALESLSIGVAVSKPDAGLIVSKRFTLSVVATGSAYAASSYEDSLQYDITVRELADNQVEVVAQPRAYRNATDMTDEQVWILDGKYGQRPRWQKLFSEIQRMMGA